MTDFNSSLNLIGPELILSLGIMAVLIFGAWRGEKGAVAVSALAGLCLIGTVYAAAFTGTGHAFSGAIVVDHVALFTKSTIAIAALFVIVLGQGYFTRVASMRFEYPVLILLSVLGMFVMVSAADLISLYIGIELQSLGLYVLAAIRRDDSKGSEAGLKYFILGALSSGLLLYGVSLIYGFSGSLVLRDIAEMAGSHNNIGLIFGLVFVISGLAFKISAAPFHMWTPDVYEGAPTPVVAFFAGAPKFAAMILFARLLMGGFGHMVDQWRNVILILAVASFMVGGLGGLMQKDIKRIMAYSSIANMGYALLALATNSTGAVAALILFFVLYMIDTLGVFAAQLSLSHKGEAVTRIEDLSGLAQLSMPLALTITVLVLSLLGMPPFSGFWGKYFVFMSAVSAPGEWPYAAAGLAASVIAAFYYLRIIKLMWFDAPKIKLDAMPTEAKWIAIGAATFSGFGVWAALSWLYPMVQDMARQFPLI